MSIRVRELIHRLQEFPPNIKVEVADLKMYVDNEDLDGVVYLPEKNVVVLSGEYV